MLIQRLFVNMDYVELWKISVYFTIVLHCLPSQMAQDLGECSPRCWDPVQLESGIFGAKEQTGVADEEECKALCVNNGTCIGIDWNKDSTSCWFQMAPLTSQTRSNTNHWSLANCTDDCVSYCWKGKQVDFSVQEGADQSKVSDENHCKLLCSSKSTCTGVNWNSSSCYLIFNDKAPMNSPGVNHWSIKRNLAASCYS